MPSNEPDGTKEAKEKLEEALGCWDTGFDTMMKYDEEFMMLLHDVSTPNSEQLPKKVRQLMYVAIFASPPNYHERALHRHIEAAIESGASHEELLWIFKVASVMGFHSLVDGAPLVWLRLGRCSYV